MHDSRLVVGAGGTGKSHRLQAWAAEAASDDGVVAWLRGSPARPVTADQVVEATADPSATIVADDLQWFEPAALDLILDATAQRRVLASRRPARLPGPAGDVIDAIDETLGLDHPVERVGLLDLDAFAPVLAALRAASDENDAGRAGATASDELEALHRMSGGSPALAADLLQVSWSNFDDEPPQELVDAVLRRVRRAGESVQEALALTAVARSIEPDADNHDTVALTALPEGTDAVAVARSARAGGLVDDEGQPIPLIERVLLADLSAFEQGPLHDRLAEVLAPAEPIRAAKHLLVGAGTLATGPDLLADAAVTLSAVDPALAARMIDRAEALGLAPAVVATIRATGAFHRGAPEALMHLSTAVEAAGTLDGSTAAIGFGLDLRDLRFDQAAARPLDGELSEPLGRLAKSLVGEAIDGPTTPAITPLGAIVTAMADSVEMLASGDVTGALGACSAAADDFDRLRPSSPLGLTPHGLGALAAITVADHRVVEVLTARGVEQLSGGPGEQLTHRLIGAYGALAAGDYRPALDALREADDPEAGFDDHALSQRDRLLLASIEAAIARRSGDTSRLRTAWTRAEDALLRQSTSWLLLDFFTEILACGARLGDEHRVEPLVDALVAQGAELPESGPGRAAANWLRLQVAIAAEDGEAVATIAEVMAGLAPTDRRSSAHQAAASAWAAVFAKKADEAQIVEVADLLAAIGEGWEASRLLGQAALDEADAAAARRLLEAARLATSDQIDDSAESGLAGLGLSEREAEVAALVAEGRTHKEIGAQLFISPKTVEHHVAKIRQKLGAESRADMLGLIRQALDRS